MARRKPTAEDYDERAARAAIMKQFMIDNRFTDDKLADILGLSRRTVQMMKAGKVTPTPPTLRKWEALLKRYGQAQLLNAS
jgi:transcriptional regulator with XRE-family HTH domain